ncbi:MAG: hypothetical protein GY928_02115 [Colwellia sp.]|nr:hypothetical protein [Colwellia sp.]
MKLTNKCLEDFEKWLCNTHTPLWREYLKHQDNSDYVFIPDSCWFGLYVDFFQSTDKKAQVYIAPFFNHDLGSMNEWGGWAYGKFTYHCKTPQEAREKVIKKANEIYNKT